MAQTDRDPADTSSIEPILKSLSSRPNVQCTLILSRKDGSIIKSSGFKEEQPIAGTSHRDYKENSAEQNAQPDVQEGNGTSSSEQATTQVPDPSPAERLAGSIYSFMKTADSLALAVYSPDISGDSFSSNKTSEGVERDQPSTEGDTDVQLLRMRTRRQEVIIFPDANYLCCVVQNLGKGGNADSRR